MFKNSIKIKIVIEKKIQNFVITHFFLLILQYKNNY